MTNKTTIRRFEYDALKYSQRGEGKSKSQGPAFLLFHASAADLKEWADVDRLEPANRRGAQRPLRELKVKKIAKFLRQDSRNTIPTSVVVAVDEGAVTFTSTGGHGRTGQHGTLTITKRGDAKPGLIIDGQHRVYGVATFSANTHVNVVAILGGDDAERAFQFVVINNSGTRISRDHVKALNLNYDKDKLNNRLIKSAGLTLGIREDRYDDLQTVDGQPPFKGLLKFPTNRKGFIPPNAIELALNETVDRAALLGIDQLEVDVFLAIWSAIKAARPEIFNANSHLLKKVPIYALTVYILESMVAVSRASDDHDPVDFTVEAAINDLVARLFLRIPEELWTVEWREKEGKELDTSGGRQKLVDALKIIDSNVRYQRPWYEGVAIINPATLPARKKAADGNKAPARPAGAKSVKKDATHASSVIVKRRKRRVPRV